MDEEELIAAVREALRKRSTAGTALTVGELYKKYKAASETRTSWSVIDDRLRPVVDRWADRIVTSLHTSDWTEYRARRETDEIPSGKPGRKYCAHTINMELQWAKAMFNWGVLAGLIAYNPIVAAQTKKTKSKRSTAPSEHDIDALLRDADPKMRVVILCGSDAGMRRGEIAALRHDWIDRGAGAIRIPAWASKNGRARKTQTTGRLLAAIDALPRHVRSQFVLHHGDGEGYHKNGLSRWYRALADSVGIEAAPGDRRPVLHDHRRGFASNATRRGMRIEVVSDLLGHASLDQTRDYVETTDDDIAVAREAFERGIDRERNR